jgi:hypothetical protein
MSGASLSKIRSNLAAGENTIFTTASTSGDISKQAPVAPAKSGISSEPATEEGQDGRRDNDDPGIKASSLGLSCKPLFEYPDTMSQIERARLRLKDTLCIANPCEELDGESVIIKYCKRRKGRLQPLAEAKVDRPVNYYQGIN